MKDDLKNALLSLQAVRTTLPRASGNPEVPRLLALARTQIETAELWISKAMEQLPDEVDQD